MKVNPLLCSDGYKSSHHKMYPEGTTLVFSNFTPRSVKYMPELAKEIVVFGIQYTVKYIVDLYEENFFNKDKAIVVKQAKKHFDSYLGVDYDVSHFEALHDLGYLPLEIRALEEGTIIGTQIPLLTIHNTLPEFYWLTNFLETLISTTLWKPLHSASISYAYNKLVKKYALKTDEKNIDFTDFQCHDFSFRGMQSLDSAISSGLGFMVASKGTDTMPVLQAAEYYYGEENVGFSVPASEHAVMTAYGKENEIDSFSRILDLYPTGIVSMVSDQYDLWQVLTVFLPLLKEKIMARDGKAVFRPDSGDPVSILCGHPVQEYDSFKEAEIEFEDDLISSQEHGTTTLGEDLKRFIKVGEETYILEAEIDFNRYDKQYYYIEAVTFSKKPLIRTPEQKGVIELLWEVFGGTVNEQGFKVLDSHVGAIYGDSITLERAEEIMKRLQHKGFASTNVVFGVGSYSMGYATRDNQGSAVKATYCEVNGVGREIFKDPITDDGTKKSAKGLLSVVSNPNGQLTLLDQCSWEVVNSESNLLKPIFRDGILLKGVTLGEIRERVQQFNK